MKNTNITTISSSFKDLVINKHRVSFDFSLNNLLKSIEYLFVIDIYLLKDRSHPNGHIGYWVFDLDRSLNSIKLSVDLSPSLKQKKIITNSGKSIDKWENSKVDVDEDIVFIGVIRNKNTNEIIHQFNIPAFNSLDKLNEFRKPLKYFYENFGNNFSNEIISFNKEIVIVCPTVNRYDAIGNFVLGLYKTLTDNGVSVKIYAENFHIELNEIVQPYKSIFNLKTVTKSYLLYLYSIYDPFLEDLIKLNFRKNILYFLKVSDFRNLQVFSTELAFLCKKSLSQFDLLKNFDDFYSISNAAVDYLTVNSSSKFLKNIKSEFKLCPPFFFNNFFKTANANYKHKKSNEILFVGRIESSKKIDELLILFNELYSLDKTLILNIVGSCDNDYYKIYLDWLIEKKNINTNSIKWFRHIPEEHLMDLYRRSKYFLTMSDDEGYCIPVVEAMLNECIVFSKKLPAIFEVTNGKTIYFDMMEYKNLARRLHKIMNDHDFCLKTIDDQNIVARSIAREANANKILQSFRV